MSFQAYLNNIEEKTGKTPREFVALAKERGYDDPSTKAGVIVDWLKTDFDLGRGHEPERREVVAGHHLPHQWLDPIATIARHHGYYGSVAARKDVLGCSLKIAEVWRG